MIGSNTINIAGNTRSTTIVLITAPRASSVQIAPIISTFEYRATKALDTTPADLMGWTSSHSGIAIERKTSNSKGQYQRFSLYADKLMKLYDQLSSSNKEKVVSYTKGLLSTQQMEEDVLAAHARTDVEQTPEGVQHDLDIMDDDSMWN